MTPQQRIAVLLAAKEAAEAERDGLRDAYTGAMEDKRMWKRRAQSAEAEAAALREAVQSAETTTATGDGLTPDETIRLHQMLHAALDQPKEGKDNDG